MFKIRQFSQLTRVSVKQLRHYDRLGLLPPARVDPATNYRYYSSDQLPRLNRLIALRDLGFSLDEIRKLLDENISADELRGMLRLRQTQIDQQLQREQARLTQVSTRLAYLEKQGSMPRYEVVLRSLSAQRVARIRDTLPDLDDSATALFDEIEELLLAQNARDAGAPQMLYHDLEYRESGADVEVAIPISKSITPTPRVRECTLPPIASCACIVYTGEYDHVGDVLQTLMVWCESNSFRVAGPLREVYLRFCADTRFVPFLPRSFLATHPEDYVTEVQLPVEKS